MNVEALFSDFILMSNEENFNLTFTYTIWMQK